MNLVQQLPTYQADVKLHYMILVSLLLSHLVIQMFPSGGRCSQGNNYPYLFIYLLIVYLFTYLFFIFLLDCTVSTQSNNL